ncbi:oligosaccharide flippase family protein [Pikeienuella sp. HZG-20]|uniref:oligosaccharide flippase family protein n=1 Tax=Paludibacillus litoralis TaxID=3133267 RepID=UPI0030ECF69E
MRRAFFFANIEQYVVALVGLASIAAVSRLLTPAEIGVAAIGLGVSTIAFAAKEFASAEFLIQRRAIDGRDIGTAFTIAAAFSAAIAGGLFGASGLIESAYAAPGVALFLEVMCLVGLADAVSAPTQALLRREMAFSVLARINVAASVATASVTIFLAGAGFGLMSIAWGQAAGAATKAGLSVVWAPVRLPTRPSVASWRAMLSFGGGKGAVTVISRVYEALPQLVLGRTMSHAAVGIYTRSNLLCGIPDRFMMSAIFSFAFPALAARVREGGDLKAAYLRALTYIAAVYCPALALVALLADPIVSFALGPGWDPVVPLVRLLALAAMFWTPMIVTTPTLFALGANRDAFLTSLYGRGFGAAVMVGASFVSLTALAASQFISIPFYAWLSLRIARRRLGFAWGDLASEAARNAAVLVSALAPPCLFVGLSESGLDMTPLQAVLCGALAAPGWLAGLWGSRHPLRDEVTAILAHLLARLLDRRGGASGAAPLRAGARR